jgi:hypothetical protein
VVRIAMRHDFHEMLRVLAQSVPEDSGTTIEYSTEPESRSGSERPRGGLSRDHGFAVARATAIP